MSADCADGEDVFFDRMTGLTGFSCFAGACFLLCRCMFREGKIDQESNVHFLHIAHSDKPVAFYNLDVIISVGYRVKSRRGVEFRR
jgi:hypothetical protein